jgi:hypothetical protein
MASLGNKGGPLPPVIPWEPPFILSIFFMSTLMSKMFNEWLEVADELTRLETIVERLKGLLPIPRSEEDVAAQAAALLELRQRLGVDPASVHPATALGKRLEGGMAGQAPAVAQLIELFVLNVDSRIAELADRAAAEGSYLKGVVRTADFSQFTYAETSTPGVLVCFGLVNSLPVNNRLRWLMADDDFYQSSDGAAVCLGVCTGNLFLGEGNSLHSDIVRRKWYLERDVLRLTASWRQHQRQAEEAQRREQETREVEKRQRRWLAEQSAKLKEQLA